MNHMTKREFFRHAIGSTSMVPGLAFAGGAEGRPRPTPIPDVLLDTHDGRKISFYSDLIRGKRVVLNTLYTNCTNICPPATANLVSVQKQLGERVGSDIFMVSLALQPDTDTPQALREYARRYGIGPGWVLLTGKKSDIDAVRRSLGFYDADPRIDADLSQHTGMVRIGNDALDRWTMLPATSPPGVIVRNILRL